MIIIEAKADQNFSKSQMESIEKDKKLLPKLLKENGKAPKVSILLLCSSDNEQNPKDYQKFFWRDLAQLYENSIYTIADELPKRKKKKKTPSRSVL